MSDLVGNPEDRFSCVAAHYIGDIIHLRVHVTGVYLQFREGLSQVDFLTVQQHTQQGVGSTRVRDHLGKDINTFVLNNVPYFWTTGLEAFKKMCNYCLYQA